MRSKQSYIDCGKKGAESRWKREPPMEARFWKNVKVLGQNDCWPWLRSFLKSGYGKTKFLRMPVGAHRKAYLLAFGEIPNGLLVCHSCDNRWCCNPAHLFLGTHLDNMKDAIKKGKLPTKLNEQKVLELRQLSKSGWSQKNIAIRFGVDQSHVSRVLSREHWGFV